MAKELEIQGLGNKTRRRVANRPFEDVQGIKNGIPVHRHTEAQEKLAEKSVAVKTERTLREEPPTKARLTIREKKRKLIRSSISLADE
ncbi:hypothetical protein [Dyadobacter frigoris]|uniref:Uncharacterized protein n=1 Tax=Dyadobacter frigoris TaxID=2576211 RepID=A0A4V6BIC8_9BACT|nr:hypothetical protein [Dyadobacter frigoris]TKT88673.1 hypothetical protein FDK13_25545 [Dyadobacter frigoris]GLU53858.1 hypothetical protein Dfri01_33190 [Dyadobacter frigoris]